MRRLLATGWFLGPNLLLRVRPSGLEKATRDMRGALENVGVAGGLRASGGMVTSWFGARARRAGRKGAFLERLLSGGVAVVDARGDG